MHALVSASEENRIARTVLLWLNECPLLPEGAIRYENLRAGVPGMAMVLDRVTYISKRYILGGYLARFHFSLLYRIQPGDSGDKRLRADEALNAIGDWACAPEHLPDLGENCRAKMINTLYRSIVDAAWENGDEDHIITFTFIYEVI